MFAPFYMYSEQNEFAESISLPQNDTSKIMGFYIVHMKTMTAIFFSLLKTFS